VHLDPAQLITHVIGFLVALWILKRYAWGPILGMIEERQERIRSELGEASQARETAEQLRTDLEERLRAIDAEGRQKIVEAVAEGQKVAAEIKETARGEAQSLIEKARQEIERERDKASVQLREDMVNLALAAATKVVEKEMSEERDRELARGFLDQVEKL
jgi:F-type H+-transporting ATPase subunit b